SACGMFIIQDIFNILVPSGSGQAAITMPLMAPLADLLGVTRQTAVLAFQMGSSFTDVLAPTSGEVIAACVMAKIPYGKWFKWLLPLFILWWVVAFAFLIIAVKIGYGPF
ncbi:MAG: TIGR00366 family protein, partial [Bacteroidales bacterium]